MFWSKKPSSKPGSIQAGVAGPASAAPRELADEFERVLEAFAAAVRVIGRCALDTPERTAQQVQDLAEHWSQHLLIRRPKPGDETRSTTVPRDYRAVLEFITEQRRQESAHVGNALWDLRETVWAFVRSLSSAFNEDAKSDALVGEHLQKLKSAAEHGSYEQLRQAAVAAAGFITQAMEQRKSGQTARTAQLGQQLTALGQGLSAPRRDGIDSVTQLNARDVFDEYATQLVELRPFVSQPSALVLVELNDFSQLASRYGAAGADGVLRAFSGCLVRTFLRKNDFLARFADHQFAIVLPDTDYKHAQVLAERLPAALRKLNIAEHPELSLSVTFGVSGLEPFDTLQTWIERAQTALQQQRAGGTRRPVPA